MTRLPLSFPGRGPPRFRCKRYSNRLSRECEMRRGAGMEISAEVGPSRCSSGKYTIGNIEMHWSAVAPRPARRGRLFIAAGDMAGRPV